MCFFPKWRHPAHAAHISIVQLSAASKLSLPPLCPRCGLLHCLLAFLHVDKLTSGRSSSSLLLSVRSRIAAVSPASNLIPTCVMVHWTMDEQQVDLLRWCIPGPAYETSFAKFLSCSCALRGCSGRRRKERERETSTSRNGGSPLERLNEIEIVDSAGSCKVEDLPPTVRTSGGTGHG